MNTVITGGAGGLGFEAAVALAGAGLAVILAGRNPARGTAALSRIRARHPGAAVRFELVDLASLASVAAFADRLDGPVDVLINNAAVMALPRRQTTQDGFEAQFGVNFLGHFALTARLLGKLRQAAAPRVIQVSSLVHARARLDLADPQALVRYRPWGAYGQSKLAMLMFALELQRRSDAGGWGLTSLAAHPGWARTAILANGPATGGTGRLTAFAMEGLSHVFGQSAAAGAQPIVYAATAAEVRPGGYYGPRGPGEMTGPPGPARVAPAACDAAAAGRLWDLAESLTGVRFPPVSPAAAA